jgi:hypothetical protein
MYIYILLSKILVKLHIVWLLKKTYPKTYMHYTVAMRRYKISLVKFTPCCCLFWSCRLIQPYLALMTWGQRKCLILLAWVSTLLANMLCFSFSVTNFQELMTLEVRLFLVRLALEWGYGSSLSFVVSFIRFISSALMILYHFIFTQKCCQVIWFFQKLIYTSIYQICRYHGLYICKMCCCL